MPINQCTYPKYFTESQQDLLNIHMLIFNSEKGKSRCKLLTMLKSSTAVALTRWSKYSSLSERYRLSMYRGNSLGYQAFWKDLLRFFLFTKTVNYLISFPKQVFLYIKDNIFTCWHEYYIPHDSYSPTVN